MHRRILRVSGAGALVAAVALAVPALAASSGVTHKRVHFTEMDVGAFISKTQTVYKVHNSRAGDGAAVVTGTSATTDKGVEYLIGASVRFRDKFTLSAPSSQGVITVTGSGQFISGTGKLKHVRGSYTFSGTYNTKTGVLDIPVRGTISY